MTKAATTVLLLLGVSTLVAASASHAKHGEDHRDNQRGGRGHFNAQTMCANSTHQPECHRRVEVCRNMHRGSWRRGKTHQDFNSCANQLNIRLPEVDSEEENYHRKFRNWARANPELKRRVFACVHQGMFNSDGSVNRPAVGEKMLAMLSSDEEPQLTKELITRINTCPEPSSHRDFYSPRSSIAIVSDPLASERRLEAEQEQRRLEAEQEQRRLEAEQEQRWLDAEQEQRRLEAEQEQRRLEAEQEQRRLEPEQEQRQLEAKQKQRRLAA